MKSLNNTQIYCLLLKSENMLSGSTSDTKTWIDIFKVTESLKQVFYIFFLTFKRGI